jgi:hypothetical protein
LPTSPKCTRAIQAQINNLGIVHHEYCTSSYLDYCQNPTLFAHAKIEIKFKLDTEKAAKATVAITASYGLGRVSEGTEYPQLAFANAIALIVIITILYGPRPAPKAM